MMDGAQLARVDWTRVARSTYLIQQSFRYDYPGPIADLRHRLVVIPPAVHGDQRRLSYRLDVGADGVARRVRRDRHGNVVVGVRAGRLEGGISFDVQVLVERYAQAASHAVAARLLDDGRLLRPTGLTSAGPELRAAAAGVAPSAHGLALAEAINSWTYEVMRYDTSSTTVATTADQAFAQRSGVCQDYSHVMLAACRLRGLPARYVSGHLLGEGGTHAWVEVIVGCAASPTGAAAVAFDPTHGRRVRLDAVTVAVGRDYADVAPTAGTYVADVAGSLTARKRVDVRDLELAA